VTNPDLPTFTSIESADTAIDPRWRRLGIRDEEIVSDKLDFVPVGQGLQPSHRLRPLLL